MVSVDEALVWVRRKTRKCKNMRPQAEMKVRAALADADKDGDGQLSEDEFKVFKKAIKK